MNTADVSALKQNWGWFLVLGLATIVLGIIAMGIAPYVSVTAVAILGGVLVVGGILQGLNSIWTRLWSTFLLDLLVGLLYVVVGLMVLTRPVQATLILTLVLGAFYVVGGVFRIIAALSMRFYHWGWLALSGVVSLILGLAILNGWPEDIWVIGLFIGIDLVFNGWFWVMLALAARNAPTISA
jgi:uncharacterized membrane protein HdeD (DUF308 family)